jgi:hypothetical protein
MPIAEAATRAMRKHDSAADADKREEYDEKGDDLVGHRQAGDGGVAQVADHEGVDDARQDMRELLDEDGPRDGKQAQGANRFGRHGNIKRCGVGGAGKKSGQRGDRIIPRPGSQQKTP